MYELGVGGGGGGGGEGEVGYKERNVQQGERREEKKNRLLYLEKQMPNSTLVP